MTNTGPVAAVLAVGDELLRGEVLDSNAAVIGAALDEAGVPVVEHAGARDRDLEIAAALLGLLRRADVVVVSGGLGPTADDRTREGLALAAGVPLLAGPGQEPESRQQDRPQGARVLPNPAGTAPGLALVVGTRIVYALPGVPHELAAMLTAQVLPDLAARFPGRPPVRRTTLRTVGLRESRVEALLAPVADRCQLAFLAQDGEVRVVLTDADPATVAQARTVLGPWSYEGTSLAAAVVSTLAAAERTVACAESLTAGMLAAALAAVPGASAVLRGGVVAYATDLKASLLGVPADLLAEHGAVSEPCAQAMATGAAMRLRADHGVALTGVAGPTAQEGHPPGTVCLGLHGPQGTRASTLNLPGGRQQVRTLAVTAALAGLLRTLPGSGAR